MPCPVSGALVIYCPRSIVSYRCCSTEIPLLAIAYRLEQPENPEHGFEVLLLQTDKVTDVTDIQ